MPLRSLMTAATAAAALAGFPAVAAAVPVNDNYLSSTAINTEGSALPAEYTDPAPPDTSDATTQGDLFNPSRDGQPLTGGGAENTTCKSTAFGKTVWYDFHPPVDGGVEIKTAGFDNVIAVYQWDDRPQVGTSKITKLLDCADDSTGVTEDLVLPENVKGGSAYTVQVGGVGLPGGLFAGGPLSFTLDFFPDSDGDGVFDQEPDKCRTTPGPLSSGGCPPDINPFASMNFDSAPGGIKITRLAIAHIPKGAKVQAKCGGCPTETKTSNGSDPVEFKKIEGRIVKQGTKIELRTTL